MLYQALFCSLGEEYHILVKGIGLGSGCLVSDSGSTHTSFVTLSKQLTLSVPQFV